MPKVSIVVPVYNVERYLCECMDSLVGQTLEDIEIICVNDGSTDGSLAILREYAARDSRIKIIDKPNAGYGHSMNVGINAATGEYMGIVESDDYVSPNMYGELYEQAKKYDAEIVKADFYKFRTKGANVFRTYMPLSKIDAYYRKLLDPSEERMVFKLLMDTWSGIYRLSFVKGNKIRYNETPGASYQDNGFWLQTFCLAHKVLFIDKPYYMYRYDNPNASVKNKNKVYSTREECKFMKAFLVNNGLYEKFKTVYAMKAWRSYLFTYNRIAAKFRPEYVFFMSKELRVFLSDGEIDPALYGKKELLSIKMIARLPILFYCLYGCYLGLKSIVTEK